MKQITSSVYFTGVMNPNLRVFDIIMQTEYGTSYNAYVVKGREKNALIEASHARFFDAYLENVQEALGGETADYLVLNHCEPDHTGCIPRLLERYPGLTIVTSKAGAGFIKNIINRPDAKIQVVQDGDELDLGGRTLRFISAPFLHWPDSMFTLLPEERVLFTCDFLGSHYCEPGIFDTGVMYPGKYRDAVRYYYDCIFGPFAPYVRQGLEKTAALDVDFACTSHGPVLTKDGVLREVREKYALWSAEPERSRKLIPVFYCSAYGHTACLAQAAARGVLSVLPDAEVCVYNLIDHDMADMAGLLNRSDAFLLGSPTLNRDAVAPVWHLLAGIDAVNIPHRPVALFGSFGWSGEALPRIAERLTSLKARVFETQVKVAFVPTEADIEAAERMGAEFAKTL